MITTHKEILALEPKPALYKRSVGECLFIKVYPTGKKCWSYKYHFQGKEKSLSIGEFPALGLKDARRKHFELQDLLSEGLDPSTEKQLKKINRLPDHTKLFSTVAVEWWYKQKPHWSEKHIKTVRSMIDNDLAPTLGNQSIERISAQELLHTLRKIEDKGLLSKAHRVLSIASQIFRYAVAAGKAERDISADIKGALTTPKRSHYAAIVEPLPFAKLLKAINEYEGSIQVANALKLAPHVFTRPGELRQATWQEINFEKALWEIPAEKMKTKKPHIVPLSAQSLNILKEQYAHFGHRDYVFPSPHNTKNPISDSALSNALKTLGYSSKVHTAHGFRASARTMLDEQLECRIEWIEQQLAHEVKDMNKRAYNRTKHLKQRQEMMTQWSQYLDELTQKAQTKETDYEL